MPGSKHSLPVSEWGRAGVVLTHIRAALDCSWEEEALLQQILPSVPLKTLPEVKLVNVPGTAIAVSQGWSSSPPWRGRGSTWTAGQG